MNVVCSRIVMNRSTKYCFFVILATNVLGLLAIYMVMKTNLDNDRRMELKVPNIYHHTKNLSVRRTTAPKPTTFRVSSASDCVNLKFSSGMFGSTGRWQNVTSEKIHYVFSAFVDGDSVRIIGAASERFQASKLFCQIWSRDITTPEVVTVHSADVRLESIPEDHGMRYSAVYYLCRIPHGVKPIAVSVTSSDPCSTPLNMMTIPGYSKNKLKFSVCVTPFNFRYSRAYELVEWIELNRIMGAEHFTFYDYSIGKNVQKVLDMYSKQGLIEVVPWKLPMGVNKWPPTRDPVEIHYFGQLASHNDCLYRNRHKTEYLFYLDLDEFAVPKKKDTKTWDDMTKQLPTGGALLFRNAFFRKEWPNDDSQYSGSDLAKKYKLVTLLKLKRERTILGARLRSKQLVRPEDIETIGIHNVWRTRKGVHEEAVDPAIGLLHHYRDWERPNEKLERVLDNSMIKYRNELTQNVQKTWAILKDVPLDAKIV